MIDGEGMVRGANTVQTVAVKTVVSQNDGVGSSILLSSTRNPAGITRVSFELERRILWDMLARFCALRRHPPFVTLLA